jgi:nucleoside-diphosphate-sugar epimerase
MDSALVIGGTGFVGRHTVADLLDRGYAVTTMSRGEQPVRFAADVDIDHLAGDRNNIESLRDAANTYDPDMVVDCAAYHPDDIRTATDVFADVEAYVYVSSGGVYAANEIPKREDDTTLHECTPDQAEDTSMSTYGPRKAECDRETTKAADRGVNAFTVRPSVDGIRPEDSPRSRGRVGAF